MKLVIDISDGKMRAVKDGTWCGSVEIANGTPLTEVLEDIKAEILDLDYLVDSAKYSDSETRCHNVDYLVSEILKIIDRHISAEGSEKE